MKLATALVGTGNSGLSVFRGIRDASRVDEYQFWAVDRDYAAQYGGEIIEAEIVDESLILDLRGCVDECGDYDGAKIEAACEGLAEAMGIDADTVVGRDQLWDCCNDDHAAAVACIKAAGFIGWRWFEGNGDNEAFCLVVA
jgi:hypothetical protein